MPDGNGEKGLRDMAYVSTTWRLGYRGWVGVLFLLIAGYAGYRGLAQVEVTPTVVVVLAAVVAAAVLVIALLAHPGPFRTAALRAAVTLAAYFLTLGLWPPGGSPAFHQAGAVVAAVLVVGLLLRHRTPVRHADAAVLFAAAAGLALALAVALRALAVGDSTWGAGFVAAGCVGAVGYLVASVVVLGPAVEVPRQRTVTDAGTRRSPEPAARAR
jgi:hypothetical protein